MKRAAAGMRSTGLKTDLFFNIHTLLVQTSMLLLGMLLLIMNAQVHYQFPCCTSHIFYITLINFCSFGTFLWLLLCDKELLNHHLKRA